MVSYSLRPKQKILNMQQLEIVSGCFLFIEPTFTVGSTYGDGARRCGGGRCRREGGIN